MKNLAKLVIAGSLFAFVACGPSAQELAEKAKADSTKLADSMAVVKKAQDDSLAAVAAKAAETQKRIADSLHADSLVKFKKMFDKDGKLIKKKVK